MDIFFTKYKDIEFKNNTLDCYEGNVLLHGTRHSGKKTLVLQTYPKAYIISHPDNIKGIIENIMDSFSETYVVLCLNIHNYCEQQLKLLTSLIDTYPLTKFICSTNRLNFSNHFTSRFVLYRHFTPHIHIRNEYESICKKENMTSNIFPQHIRTYHDMIIYLDLQQYSLKDEDCFPYKRKITELATKLSTASHESIRKYMYDILSYNAPNIFAQLIEALNLCYPDYIHYIYQKGATHEWRLKQGNKQIYHYEAFLFDLKNHMYVHNNEQIKRCAKNKSKKV